MLHIPILRHGKPYESVEKTVLVHHATGEPLAVVSQANGGLIVRDIRRMDGAALERFSIAELLAACRKAADLFRNATLPLSDAKQSFDDYVVQLSATTGLPQTLCRANADKIYKVMNEMDVVIAGLTRGLDPVVLDRGHGTQDGRRVSFFRAARVFGAVLPGNSPGVHSLWIPAVALKTPLALKPGGEEPWTPYRVIESLCAAGLPREAFGLYPTDHAGAAELLRAVDRAMLFGDAATTRPWAGDPRVQIHGPGYSKVILGPDTADGWERYLEVMVSSILANGGRSCLNASGVWTPQHGRDIAEALAERLAAVPALPADHPDAQLAAFANPKVAESISATIDRELGEPGAADVTQDLRRSPRLVALCRCRYLLPTIIWCPDRGHSLASREFLFPFASVVECPAGQIAAAIGPTLVATAITADRRFADSLMASPNVDRLNLGPVPTWRISWDQPHEGNLFELLYRQRAFQIEPAA